MSWWWLIFSSYISLQKFYHVCSFFGQSSREDKESILLCLSQTKLFTAKEDRNSRCKVAGGINSKAWYWLQSNSMFCLKKTLTKTLARSLFRHSIASPKCQGECIDVFSDLVHPNTQYFCQCTALSWHLLFFFVFWSFAHFSSKIITEINGCLDSCFIRNKTIYEEWQSESFNGFLLSWYKSTLHYSSERNSYLKIIIFKNLNR